MTLTSHSVPSAGAVSLDTDNALLDDVLLPYKENCRYLKTALVERDDDERGLSVYCTFEIPESCYIEDTGHFNAVEFNICYNQMAYYLIAKAVQESLIEPFTAWSMADYWERQLPDILIADFQSKFRRPIHSGAFAGSLRFGKVLQRKGERPLIIIGTECEFSDSSGGRAEGVVKLAITNPPL
jgi:hypothetical protein